MLAGVSEDALRQLHLGPCLLVAPCNLGHRSTVMQTTRPQCCSAMRTAEAARWLAVVGMHSCIPSGMHAMLCSQITFFSLLWAQHDGSAAVDEQGWFSTGDVATLDEQGFMQITDRSKDVIKSGGTPHHVVLVPPLWVSRPTARATSSIWQGE